ncbi:MAG: LacI family DNA-binding transcriptional regulator [Chloroflexota bacterium]
MTVSIKDIAKVMNISYSTVSRALNDSPRVNPETRRRIQDKAAEMGYLPSAVARSLVTRRTHIIGLVVTTITDLFFAEVIHAIEETAVKYKYNVILANSNGKPEHEVEVIRALRERRVDGIILISPYSSKENPFTGTEIDLPVVAVNKFYQEYIGYSVGVDNHNSSREATQHLLDLGHRRIAHIAGLPEEWDSMERQKGYEQALQAGGLPVDPALIVRSDGRPKAGTEAMQQLLALPARPTAVFCYNDATALGAMRAAYAAGRRIPQDLSVVGFDDIDLARYFEPPLTTIAQPKREMGGKAVQMILNLLAGDKVEDCMLPGRLIVRASTMPLQSA